MTTHYIGIDIGGTKSAALLMTDQGKIVKREQFATFTGEGGWQKTLNRLHTIIQPLLTDFSPQAIGVSCGGPLDGDKGMILSPPNLPGWINVPVVRILKDRYNLPAYLENDANAGALAEWRFGAGRGTRNMIFLTFGTGLGAGLILNGQLHTGTNHLGGEVGHIRLDDDGPMGFHKRGSVEGFCSGTALSQMMGFEVLCLAEEIGKKAAFTQYKTPGDITGKDVVEWALNNDPLACLVVQKSGRYLGKLLSMMIDCLNPEIIVIGSMGVRLKDLLIGPAWEVIRQEAIPEAAEVCRIVPAELGESIGDYAALCVAMSGE